VVHKAFSDNTAATQNSMPANTQTASPSKSTRSGESNNILFDI
jgi:hypothetical protein